MQDEKPPSYAKRQAKEFASSLIQQVEYSAKIVNKNLEKSRNQMKSTYDKRNSNHEIHAGDYVMLWWPYFKKGTPRSFQPKWKGPYMVKELIGSTNCKIVLTNGSYKNVHLNQLKPIVHRDIGLQVNTRGKKKKSIVSEPVNELFMDLYDDNNRNENEDLVRLPENEINYALNDRWCGLDEANILGPSSRSGIRR